MPLAPQDGRMDSLPALAELERGCFGAAAWSLQQLDAELHRTGLICRVIAGSKPTELCALALGWSVEDESELLRIAVHPSYRRRGLGTILLTDFMDQAWLRGARTCFLDVRSDNHPAIGLYLDRGFHSIGSRKAYYSDGCDAQLMRAELSESSSQ